MALAVAAGAGLVGRSFPSMSANVYYILHVFSVFVLTGFTFHAFAAPAETKKKVMAITGIASLLALVGGFGLIAKVHQNHIEAWMIVKLVCWLGLSALAGIGYRKREKARVLRLIAMALVFVAVLAVYTRLAF